MMESFKESKPQLCKDNISESALDRRKKLMEHHHDLQKSLQSRHETVKTQEKKPEEPRTSTKTLGKSNVYCEIKDLCDKADGRGLRNYFIANIKLVSVLKRELRTALLESPDAARVVANALEPTFSPNTKAHILLLESFYTIFANDDRVVIASDVKSSAQEIAKALKKEMKIERNTGQPSMAYASAFLKLLASFRIAADYERDELWGLLLTVGEIDQTIELCRSLGLSPHLSEFIDKLSKSGKQLEALKYAHAFGILDKVDHMDLLTSYLRDVEKAAKEVVPNGRVKAASQAIDLVKLQSNANVKLRAALRDVIRLVQTYGFKSHFFEDELRKLEQEEGDRINDRKIARRARKRNRKKAAKEKAQEKEDGKKADEKKAQEKEERKEAAEKKVQEKEEKEDGKKPAEKKEQEKKDGKKAAEKTAQQTEGKEDGRKAPEKKAQEKQDGKKAAEKEAQGKEDKEDRRKAVEKKAQEKRDGKKDAQKNAQEKEEQEDRKKDTQKKEQHKRRQLFEPGCGISERENYASKRAKHASLNEKTREAKKMSEEEEGNKAPEKKAQEKEEKDGKKAAEKKAQEIKEKEDRKKDVEKNAQYKRRQSFEPGYGLSEWENYASKRVKDTSLNKTTRVAGVMDNSKALLYDTNGVQNKYGNIVRDHYPSDLSAANTGLAAGAFAPAPSFAAQINERRRHEGYPLAFGTSNLTPVGSPLYSSSVPAGGFAFQFSNVAEVNYEGRGLQSYSMNFGEVDKNRVRTSVYGTGDFANSFATHSNHNFEGIGEESYKLNFGEIDNNPVRASAYATGILIHTSAIQHRYERRVPELHTSTFGGGNTVGIGSYAYGSNPSTIPAGVNQGSPERSLEQSSGFVGRNMVHAESSAYGSGVSTVPYSSVSQGHFERRGSVIEKYPELHTSTYGGGNMAGIGSSVYKSNPRTVPSGVNQGSHERSLEQSSGFVGRNMVHAESSGYGSGVSTVPYSSVSQGHFERRGSVIDKYPELHTSAYGGGNMAGIGSSVYGSNPCTVPSGVNQGSHERSLQQSSGFSGRNMVPAESSGYGSGVSTVPPSSVGQGHFESRGSAIDRYRFNSGLTSLPPAH